MEPTSIYSRETIAKSVADRFRESYEGKSGTKLIGILLGRPESIIFKQQIYNDLRYFGFRSGPHIDFYLIGWGKIDTYASWLDQPGVSMDDTEKRTGTEWKFDEKRFIESCKLIEKETTWEYSGETDLILVNAKFESKREEVTIDFTKTICFQLEVLKEIGAMPSIARLFEKIVKFAERYQGNDPASSLSNKKGIDTLLSGAKEMLLSATPETVNNKYKELEQFAVRDISRQK
ncbi:MAG: hypothetical protein KDB22_25700 [Planctomycetales bacterium]|nr:hypothetical protein [Planctomycetales bacterium]